MDIYLLDRRILRILRQTKSEAELENAYISYEASLSFLIETYTKSFLEEKGFNEEESERYIKFTRSLDEEALTGGKDPEDAKAELLKRFEETVDKDETFQKISEELSSDQYNDTLDSLTNGLNQQLYEENIGKLSDEAKQELDQYIAEIEFKQKDSVQTVIDANLDQLVGDYLKNNPAPVPTTPPTETPTPEVKSDELPKSGIGVRPIYSYP